MSWFPIFLLALGGLGLAAVLLLKSDPKFLARIVRYGGGGLAGLAALLLLVTGRVFPAMILAGIAAWLFGRPVPFFQNFGFGQGGAFSGFSGSSGPQAGQTSEIETGYLRMTLDHDSGQMNGRVLAGAFAGRSLEELNQGQIEQLLAECAGEDEEGARLLHAYIGRRFGEGTQGKPKESAGSMTRARALEVLGLPDGASEDEIRHAHKRLMLKMHPDQGGTTYLAAQLNQAKDILLNGR